MVDNNGEWTRLHSVIMQSGMSINAFAKHIGLPRGENIYRIKRGLNGISRDVADKVVHRFPKISKGWLLTGEGSMYLDNQS